MKENRIDRDRYEVFLFCFNLLKNYYLDWVVLDTETTGLNYIDQIIDIAVISKHGSTILDTLIKPTCSISSGAFAVHGLDYDVLESAPLFPEIYPELKSAIEGKLVFIYNADFDVNKLRYRCELDELPMIDFTPKCLMELYAKYYGEWSSYWGNYKWQKLPGGNHRAKGDAIAARNLIYKMAEPLTCMVDLQTPPFPAKQIYLDWVEFFTLSFKISKPVVTFRDKDNEKDDSKDDDWDIIPF